MEKCTKCGMSQDDFEGRGKKSKWGILCDLKVRDGRHSFKSVDGDKPEYLPKESVTSTQEDNRRVVATVDKHEAIDFTPIYYINVHKNIGAGSVLRFDAAEVVVRLETRGGKA